jgi:uncharacterized protein YggE
MSKVAIRVRGSAQREVPPDFAQVSVRVSSVDADRDAALAATAERTARVRSAAEATDGVLQVAFGRISVAVNRRHVDGVMVEDGYVATMTGTVKVAADDAAALTTAVVAHGADISWVSWTLDDDNPAHRHVRALAVADAERAAQDFADALGRTLGDLELLADPGLDTSAPAAARAAGGFGKAAAPAELTFDPQPCIVRAAVVAHYSA